MKSQLHKQLFCSLLLYLFTPVLFAANGHFYLGGSLGASVAEFDDSNPEINYYHGYLNDAYPLDDNDETAGILGINAGYEFAGKCLMPSIALGLGFYGTNDYDFNGELIETALGGPASTLYDYEFDVRNRRIMAEAQFTWLISKLAPFINIGLGPSWNRMSDYSETPATSDGYVPLPPFESHTNVNLAYQVGVGIGYAFNFSKEAPRFKHERISIGYRYANLGDASFGTRGDDYPHSLKMNDLKTNDIYINYTHFFW